MSHMDQIDITAHGHGNQKLSSLTEPTTENPKHRLRVLHVVEYLGLAGMEYGVIKQVNRLDPSAFSPMICCLRFQVEATHSLINRSIPIFELRKNRGRDLGVIVRLASLLRRQRVDIVHSHNWQTFFYTIMASLLARTPVIVHGEHGRDGQMVSQRQLWIQGFMGKWVNSVVTVSSSLEKELGSKWKIQLEKFSTIPNGVDLEGFSRDFQLEKTRKELKLSPDALVVLSVGGLRPVKDHETLIRGFAKMEPDFSNAYLLIVGREHSQGVQANLESLAQKMGIREKVLFLGVRHDVPQLMQLSNVYINTSLFEGMSNTILEAMASGRPVIATRVGGNPELVHR